MDTAETSASRIACGIIMPISDADAEHTEAHWMKVLDILSIASRASGLDPRPVWQGSDFDVIQSRILQNLYENEIAICDVSTRNPNVMLELGMRLTTKKPTIIVAEEGTKLPFDTGVIHTEFYDCKLQYHTTQDFIERLSKTLSDTIRSVEEGRYHSFVEHFRFETVQPSTITVSANEHWENRLREVVTIVKRIDDALPLARGIPWVPNEHRSPTTVPDMFDKDHSSTVLHALRADPAMQVGVIVLHQKFGKGEIAEVDGNKLEVDFFSAGRKRVMTSFVQVLTDG
jgi:hypothetical protein